MAYAQVYESRPHVAAVVSLGGMEYEEVKTPASDQLPVLTLASATMAKLNGSRGVEVRGIEADDGEGVVRVNMIGDSELEPQPDLASARF